MLASQPMSEPPQPIWVLRADGEVVRAEEPVRLSLVPEIADDDVVEVVVGTGSLPPIALPATPRPRDPTPAPREPRSRAISVTGVGDPTPQAPRRPVSAVGRIRPIKERDRRASLEVDPGDDSRAQRGRELYRQAVEQLRAGHRSQALSTLRLAASFAPGEARYAEALRAVERGEDLA